MMVFLRDELLGSEGNLGGGWDGVFDLLEDDLGVDEPDLEGMMMGG